MGESVSRVKKIEPAYQQVLAEEVNIVAIPGGHVRILSGPQAKLSLHTKVIYQDVELEGNQQYSINIEPGMRGFVYLLSGEIVVLGETVKETECCFIEKCTKLGIYARKNARFLLCFGLPHNQPIIQHGSFVD